MRYSVCNEMFQGWEIADVFRSCAERGYDGVEIQPATEAFATCGRATEGAGVFFGLEPLTGSNFISSVAKALDLVR